MPDTTFIYGLLEPDTGKLRYVGKTSHPRTRFLAHLRDERPSRKKDWIGSLKSRGVLPTMQLLLEVPKMEWEFWEQDTIQAFREAGYDLVNLTDGGGGTEGHNLSDEHKQKLSLAHIGKPAHENTKQALVAANLGNQYRVGKKHSEERKIEIGAFHQGRKRSLETCANISAGLLGKTASPESKERMRMGRFRYRALKHSEKFFV